MKLENQVCSLEQAKKLKELGIKQDSLISFFGDETPRLMDNCAVGVEYGPWIYLDTTEPANNQAESLRQDIQNTIPLAAAFTVAELGVMLPSETLTIRRGSEDSEFPNWEWENESHQNGWGTFNTEAQARADHLIMLLEKKLITRDEVNQRLNH